MQIQKKFIFPEQWYLALFLKEENSNAILSCSKYPRINKQGFVFALPAQKGCAVGCSFCSVPRYFGDITPGEIQTMIDYLNTWYPHSMYYGDWKLSFVKGGELLLNKHCLEILQAFGTKDLKISSVFPDTAMAKRNIRSMLDWYGSASKNMTISMQVSLLSTSAEVRNKITRYPLLGFRQLRDFGEEFFGISRRKVTLSITCTDDLVCDPNELLSVLPPEYFSIRMYPYNANAKALCALKASKILHYENAFAALGYKIIPCTNPFGVAERKLGYFDPENANIEDLVLMEKAPIFVTTPPPVYRKNRLFYKSDKF